jgi:hypothetical protein
VSASRTDSPAPAHPRGTGVLDGAAQALVVFVTGLAGVFGLRQLDDYDTWWHLAAGRFIAANRYVPDTDVLSYTVPDAQWLNLQWLYDLALYALHAVGGAQALVIALAVCTLATFALLARNVARSVGPVAASLALLVGLVITNERILIRPEMASFVLMQAVLWVLASARDDEGRRLWLLAPLMLVWVNVHALFVLGAALIAAAVVAALAAETALLPRRWREASRWSPAARNRLLIASVAAALATCINPWHLHGALFPLELFTRINGSNSAFAVIGEFRRPFSGYFPTFAIGAYQVYLLAGAAVVVLAAVVEATSRGRRHVARFDVAGLLVFAIFAWLSLLARRNIGVFVLATLPFVAACARILAERVPSAWQSRLESLRPLALGAVTVAASTMLAMFVTNSWFALAGETHAAGLGVFEANFPVRASAFVREHHLPGRLYNDLTAGGYLTWSNPTGDGVYVDGRLEVYDEFFRRYLDSLGNPAVFTEEVERWGIGSVLLFHRWGNRHGLIAWLARNPEWVLVYHDPVAAVFTRRPDDQGRLARLVTAGRVAHDAMLEELLAAEPEARWDVARYTSLVSWARLHETLGDPLGADHLWEAVTRMRAPSDLQVAGLIFHGRYLEWKGQKASALASAERALELDPGNATASALATRLGASAP